MAETLMVHEPYVVVTAFGLNIFISNHIHIHIIKHITNNLGFERKLRTYFDFLLNFEERHSEKNDCVSA